MQKKTICIDIDNVVANSDEIVRRVIRDCTDGRVNLAYENIVDFDYYKCTDASGSSITREEWSIVHDAFSQPKYLWMVQPADGVQDCLRRLSETFYIHFATSRLPSAWGTTVDWLKSYEFPLCDLHFIRHCEKHVSLGKFTAAVEDCYDQAAAFCRSGTPCYLIEHPWNINMPALPNLYWVKTWRELTDSLIELPLKIKK